MDTDLLIQLIEQQPALWDKSSILFKDRVEKDKAWCLVAEGLYGLNVDNEEKQEKITAIKNKWKNIRDCYIKYINQGKSGEPAPKKRKYVYADALSFLSSAIEKRRTSGNMEHSPDPGDESIDVADSPTTEDDDMEDGPNGPNSASDTDGARNSTPRPKQPRKSAKISEFQAQLLNKLEKRSLQPEDPDKLFLLSVLPDMKTLDDRAKREFKMHVLQFFNSPSASARHSHFPYSYPSHSDWYSHAAHPSQQQRFLSTHGDNVPPTLPNNNSYSYEDQRSSGHFRAQPSSNENQGHASMPSDRDPRNRHSVIP